jgi:hypothetical protein
MSETVPAPAAAESRMVSAPGDQLQVRDFPGVEPALVALHGFPDDSRICDQVAPLLAPPGSGGGLARLWPLGPNRAGFRRRRAAPARAARGARLARARPAGVGRPRRIGPGRDPLRAGRARPGRPDHSAQYVLRACAGAAAAGDDPAARRPGPHAAGRRDDGRPEPAAVAFGPPSDSLGWTRPTSVASGLRQSQRSSSTTKPSPTRLWRSGPGPRPRLPRSIGRTRTSPPVTWRASTSRSR